MVTENRFHVAVKCPKDCQDFHEVASRPPDVLESNFGGQGMGLVAKRWDVPIRQETKERVQDPGREVCDENVRGCLVRIELCGKTENSRACAMKEL